MSSTPAAVSPSSAGRWSLVARAGAVALVLGIEKVLLGLCIDRGSDEAAQGFSATVRELRHWSTHFAVAFAVALVVLIHVQRRPRLFEISSSARQLPLRWRWLLLNVLLCVALVPLTRVLSGGQGSVPALLGCGALWLLLALGAVTAALAAGAPLSVWRQGAGAVGMVWLYAAIVAAIGASAVSWSQMLWAPAARLTFALVWRLLSPFIPSLHGDAASLILTTDRFAVMVSDQCSGLEGVGMMLAFCGAWLVYFRREYVFPRALLLLPAGLLLIFALNVLRIAALVLIGHAGYPGVAIQGFHSQAGWISFNLAAVSMVYFSRRSRWLNRAARQDAGGTTENPTASYLLPLLTVLAVGIATTAASAGFDRLYGLRLPAAAVVLALCWPRLAALDWRCSWRGPLTGAAVFGVWIAAAYFLMKPAAIPAGLAVLSPTARTFWIAAKVAAAVVTVPIVEELAYRGFLLRRLEDRDFETVRFSSVGLRALLLSALIFGIAHGGMWPAGIVAGLAYGWIVRRTARIGEAVAAHATTNALLAVAVLFWNQWQLW